MLILGKLFLSELCFGVYMRALRMRPVSYMILFIALALAAAVYLAPNESNTKVGLLVNPFAAAYHVHGFGVVAL